MAALAMTAVALAATAAQAHRLSFSKGRWHLDDDAATVEAKLFLDVLSLPPAFSVEPPPLPAARPAWRAAERDAVLAAIAAGIVVTSQGNPCPVEGLALEAKAREDVVIASLRWQCPRSPGLLAITLTFLARLPSDHRHLARLEAGGRVTLRSLDADRPTIIGRLAPRPEATAPGDTSATAPNPGAPGVSFGELLARGVHHIGMGFDHLLFLLALLIAGGRLRSLAGIVSAFTLGHSVTLALAALDVLRPDEAFIEVAIAASIVMVGLENLWTRRLAPRWTVAGLFGLVHGFGFAGALRDLGLSRAEMVEPLVAFNLGVEAGQLVVVLALAWPLTRYATRPWYRRRVVLPVSLAVAAAGTYWLVERLL